MQTKKFIPNENNTNENKNIGKQKIYGYITLKDNLISVFEPKNFEIIAKNKEKIISKIINVINVANKNKKYALNI